MRITFSACFVKGRESDGHSVLNYVLGFQFTHNLKSEGVSFRVAMSICVARMGVQTSKNHLDILPAQRRGRIGWSGQDGRTNS